MRLQYLNFRLGLVGLVVYLLLDGVWLGLIQNQAWKEQIRQIQSEAPIFRADFGALAYLCLILFLLLFVLPLAKSLSDAVLYGALGGILIYGVFDATTLAMFHRYAVKTAVLDVLWGGFVTASAAGVVYWVAHL